jgi:hypothetical protein
MMRGSAMRGSTSEPRGPDDFLSLSDLNAHACGQQSRAAEDHEASRAAGEDNPSCLLQRLGARRHDAAGCRLQQKHRVFLGFPLSYTSGKRGLG